MKNLFILIFIALVPTFASAQLFCATNEEAVFVLSETQSRGYELQSCILHDRLQYMSYRTPDGWRMSSSFAGGYGNRTKIGDKTYSVDVVKGGSESWQRNTKTQLSISVITEDPEGDLMNMSSQTMFFEYDHKTKVGKISMLRSVSILKRTWETDREVVIRELEAHLMNAEKFL